MTVLPAGAVLVHVGPYKTGSTALQAALHEARGSLAEHGVAYAGTGTRSMRAGWSVLGETPRGRREAGPEEWDALAADIRSQVRTGAAVRVCVSSEDFSMGGPEVVRRIVDGIGADHVHALVVARRLDRLVPSQWQQRTQEFGTVGYEDFVHAVVDPDVPDTDPVRRTFWRSHDLDDLVTRWRDALGPDRVVVVVADEADHGLVPRAFEDLLGLPEGLLVPSGRNRSLSANGVELFRRLNEVAEQRGWPDDVYALAAKAVVTAMQHAPPSDHEQPVPRLPAWAADRVRALSEERAAALAAHRDAGVRVLGDPDRLLVVEPGPDTVAPVESIGVDTAVAALAGLVDGHRKQRRRARAQHRELVTAARRRKR